MRLILADSSKVGLSGSTQGQFKVLESRSTES